MFIRRRIKDPLPPVLGEEWISMLINNQGGKEAFGNKAVNTRGVCGRIGALPIW